MSSKKGITDTKAASTSKENILKSARSAMDKTLSNFGALNSSEAVSSYTSTWNTSGSTWTPIGPTTQTITYPGSGYTPFTTFSIDIDQDKVHTVTIGIEEYESLTMLQELVNLLVQGKISTKELSSLSEMSKSSDKEVVALTKTIIAEIQSELLREIRNQIDNKSKSKEDGTTDF